MADYIPFVNSVGDIHRLNNYFADAKITRVPLSNLRTFEQKHLKYNSLWLDPQIDGYHRLIESANVWSEWQDYISQFKEHQIICENKPNKTKLERFVFSVLDTCQKYKADFITIPQLPVASDNSRNPINKLLVIATYRWKQQSDYKGKLIYPIIFTHQEQLKGKTQWSEVIKRVETHFKILSPEGIWAVDSDISDWRGGGRFEKRFESLIEFHKHLRSVFSKVFIIAGPYWGMNLVLWSRNLIDYPAINLGSTFKYFISGGWPSPASSTRIAIAPIRRLAVANIHLRKWLSKVTKKLNPSDSKCKDLIYLLRNFDQLLDKNNARNQVANFYKEWFSQIESIQVEGRNLALYQDLSSAFVFGAQLGKIETLPSTESPARAPERIARQLMLSCL